MRGHLHCIASQEPRTLGHGSTDAAPGVVEAHSEQPHGTSKRVSHEGSELQDAGEGEHKAVSTQDRPTKNLLFDMVDADKDEEQGHGKNQDKADRGEHVADSKQDRSTTNPLFGMVDGRRGGGARKASGQSR